MTPEERQRLVKDTYKLQQYIAQLERLAVLAPPEAERPKFCVVAADARQWIDTRVRLLCAYVDRLETERNAK